MMKRIEDGNPPNLVLLRYTSDWAVQSVIAVHSVFLTPLAVERRAPLSASAKRAGWVGCNLLLNYMPPDGKITLAQDGAPCDRMKVRRQYAQAMRLGVLAPARRGWTALILSAIRGLGKVEFSIWDVYAKEQFLGAIYPENANVRAKIRQQLQVLRDLGYLEFLPVRGSYRLLLRKA